MVVRLEADECGLGSAVLLLSLLLYHIALWSPLCWSSSALVSLQVTVAIGRVGSSVVRVGCLVRTGHVVSASSCHHGRGSVTVHAHVSHGGVWTGVTTGTSSVALVNHGLDYSPSCIDEPIVDLED